ncbi:DNA-directed RNA polymerase I subunit rpa49 [Selaginella moellendorffii]|nr:DNA-directed RNA polymerase I subunit rpa49 [Selaginella moellendorffii]|eukprot:XP_002974007.2 DNA-directed RNA polymerase I subunit rpa49 [Selaginella moellendorffii]
MEEDDGAAPSTSSAKRKKRSRQKVTLDVLAREEGAQLPILAYFPTPFDPCAQQPTKDDQSDPPELYASTKNSQMQLVVRPPGGNVDFVGANVNSEAGAWNPTMFALGVFDKEEGTLKIVPVVSNKVLRMEPRVRGVSYMMDYGNQDDTEVDREMRIDRKNTLVNRFGTKKAKNALQRMSRAVVKETALGGSDEQFKGYLQDAVQQEGLVMTRKEVEKAANAAMVRRIPPYNLDAKAPDDAYPLNKIITKEEWQSMDSSDLMKAAKKAAELEALRSQEKYWNFILDRIHRLRVDGDREGNAKRSFIMVYLNYLLLMFHATRGRVVSGRNPFFDEKVNLDMPQVIYDKLSSMFLQDAPPQTEKRGSGGSGKLLHRDYLLSYILVLAMKLDGFTSDAQDMATELKMTVTDLQPHYAQLGCKVEAPHFRGAAKAVKPKVTMPLPLNLDQEDPANARSGGGGGGRGRGRGR